MATTFLQDVRPKFRAQDMTCMSRAAVLLGDGKWMCDPSANHGFADHGNARHVYAALKKGVMPPDKKWPQEWLDIFESWMAEGFQPGT